MPEQPQTRSSVIERPHGVVGSRDGPWHCYDRPFGQPAPPGTKALCGHVKQGHPGVQKTAIELGGRACVVCLSLLRGRR